jgi:mRNA-degrading endonuclease RelE of RelBE toxin-antitoxin system
MRVEITRRADKDLLNLDDATRKRVLTALRSLQEQPTPSDIKKIKGQPDRWRL